MQATLTSGLSRLRSLIICPFVNASTANSDATGWGNGSLGISAINSPWASEPGTCSYGGGMMTNFNVAISGKNIYQNSKTLNFENFLQETRGANSINSANTVGLNSGLISQLEKDSIYGYQVVSLARHSDADDSVSRSVAVTWTNSSKFVLDYICFLVYEKEIQIDISLGAIVNN